MMYCRVSCRDSDWSKSHKHSCFFTRSCYQNPDEAVLDLSKTQVPNKSRKDTFSGGLNILLRRLVHFIGIDQIRSAALKNEPMLSWSDNDPRTRGFRDGKFSTVDLEALISLEGNLEKLSDAEVETFAKACSNLTRFKKKRFANAIN
jgi:hypothetical protein